MSHFDVITTYVRLADEAKCSESIVVNSSIKFKLHHYFSIKRLITVTLVGCKGLEQSDMADLKGTNISPMPITVLSICGKKKIMKSFLFATELLGTQTVAIEAYKSLPEFELVLFDVNGNPTKPKEDWYILLKFEAFGFYDNSQHSSTTTT
jgi:hypothetical protein